MDTLYEVDQNKLINEVAKSLSDKIEKPDWVKFVKTGAHVERPPLNGDWWYVRSASILRTVYLKGPIGTSSLRKKYGGKRNLGVKPSKTYKASGKIIRTILQLLEKEELVRFKDSGVKKGRVATKKGVELLNKTAESIKED